VVLGVLLIGVVRIENEFTVYTVAGFWALFGSMVLFSDAMRIRQRVLQRQAMSASSSGPDLINEGKSKLRWRTPLQATGYVRATAQNFVKAESNPKQFRLSRN
jgi:hypothetical protein